MNSLERIAKIVSTARKKVPMSQAELAAKAHIGSTTLERIEQARAPMPKETTLRRIAKALDMEYETAFGTSAQQSPHRGRMTRRRDVLRDIPDDLAESFALLAESYGMAPADLMRRFVEADRLVIKE